MDLVIVFRDEVGVCLDVLGSLLLGVCVHPLVAEAVRTESTFPRG